MSEPRDQYSRILSMRKSNPILRAELGALPEAICQHCGSKQRHWIDRSQEAAQRLAPGNDWETRGNEDVARCKCGSRFVEYMPLTPEESLEIDPDKRPSGLIVCDDCGERIQTY